LRSRINTMRSMYGKEIIIGVFVVGGIINEEASKT
jgi:hypothetical protein